MGRRASRCASTRGERRSTRRTPRLARGDRAVRLPPKPFGTFEIRFGASATSSKWTKPPKSGMLQVNLANHDSREVRKWDADLAAAPTTNAVHTAKLVAMPISMPVDGYA